MQTLRVINLPQYRLFPGKNTYGTNWDMVQAINQRLRLPMHEKEALERVDRRFFVPKSERPYVPFKPTQLMEDEWRDMSTATRPFLVALSVRLLGNIEGKRILEIGAGCGYQTAILDEMVGPKGKVVAAELFPWLIETAKNAIMLADTGRRGWFSRTSFFASTTEALAQGPFDAIVVCCAISLGTLHSLAGHLTENGGIVAPVGYAGSEKQHLTKFIPKKKVMAILNRLDCDFVSFQPEAELAMG